jgi:diphosphomevalonate decarboxylase
MSPLLERVRMVVAIVGGGTPKARGSRDAMEHTAATSPFYPSWVELVPRDLDDALVALRAGELEKLGPIAEANALAMHASAMAARPAVIYFQPATIALLNEVRGLRACGVAAWATMDAGPHVKILTTEQDAPTIAMRIKDIEGVTAVTISAAGPAAAVV